MARPMWQLLRDHPDGAIAGFDEALACAKESPREAEVLRRCKVRSPSAYWRNRVVLGGVELGDGWPPACSGVSICIDTTGQKGMTTHHKSVVSGGVLLSHTLPCAVPSALKGLTSGFGMGPGVSLSPWPPKQSHHYSTITHASPPPATPGAAQIWARDRADTHDPDRISGYLTVDANNKRVW
jgi:hypothetical protein